MALREIISILNEANKKYDALYQEHHDLKIRYNRLYQDLMKLQDKLLCQDCKTRYKKEEEGGYKPLVE